ALRREPRRYFVLRDDPAVADALADPFGLAGPGSAADQLGPERKSAALRRPRLVDRAEVRPGVEHHAAAALEIELGPSVFVAERVALPGLGDVDAERSGQRRKVIGGVVDVGVFAASPAALAALRALESKAALGGRLFADGLHDDGSAHDGRDDGPAQAAGVRRVFRSKPGIRRSGRPRPALPSPALSRS